MSAILRIIGPILKFLVGWFTSKNTKEMVARAEAQNVQLNTDEIRRWIHQYHFGATPEIRERALIELRRMGAMT